MFEGERFTRELRTGRCPGKRVRDSPPEGNVDIVADVTVS
jgi:hypothetical protein